MNAKGPAHLIEVGAVVSWDGDTWAVAGLGPTSVHLKSRTGRGYMNVAMSEVTEHGQFEVINSAGDSGVYGGVQTSALDEFPKDIAEAALELEADLLTMETGYPTGVATRGAEPDARYAGLTVKERCEVLAAIRGVQLRAVYRWKDAYAAQGVAGLVDQRQINLSAGVNRIDPILRRAILAELDAALHASRITKTEMRNRVRRHLDALRSEQESLPVNDRTPVPDLPGQRTFDRYVDILASGRPRHLTQANQRNAASRPVGVGPWLSVTRPMEVVMLDTTPLDMFAFNPDETGNGWLPVFLTLAVDVFSRSIVGWVFTSADPRSEDISLLLHRIASPKPWDSSWPVRGAWRYPGAPETIVFGTGSNPDDAPNPSGVGESVAAGVPFGQTESFVVDHGKAYIADATREAARVLGSNLQLARVRTPTDKPQVEAAFGRIREQFVMRLPGYKGPDLASRGTQANVEDAAFLFLWEVEAAFAEWVACDYQTSTHRGLRLQTAPTLDLSPNEMWDFGVTRSGLLPVPPPPATLIELLPTAWRTVQPYGVEIGGIRYDSDELNEYRGQKSPWLAQKGKWRLKFDRSDRSRVWFWAIDLDSFDPTDGQWILLTWRGYDHAPLFADAEIAYAKAIILGRGGNVRDQTEFESTLERVLDRIKTEQALPVSERRMAAQTYLRAYTGAAARSAADASFSSLAHLTPVPTTPANNDGRGPGRGTGPVSPQKARPLRRPTAAPALTVVESPDDGIDDTDFDFDDIPTVLLRGPDEVEIDFFGDDNDEGTEDLLTFETESPDHP